MGECMWESEGGKTGFYKTGQVSPCGETVWGLWKQTSTRSCWFAKHKKSGSHRNSAITVRIWVSVPSWSLITEVCVCVSWKHLHRSVVVNIKKSQEGMHGVDSNSSVLLFLSCIRDGQRVETQVVVFMPRRHLNGGRRVWPLASMAPLSVSPASAPFCHIISFIPACFRRDTR